MATEVISCIKMFDANDESRKQALPSLHISLAETELTTVRSNQGTSGVVYATLFTLLTPPISTPPPIERDRWKRVVSTYSRCFHRFRRRHRFTENRVCIFAGESCSIGSLPWLFPRKDEEPENQSRKSSIDTQCIDNFAYEILPPVQPSLRQDKHMDIQTYLRSIDIWRRISDRIAVYSIVLTELKKRVLGQDARNAGGQPAPKPEKPKPAPKPEKKKPAPKPGRRGDTEPQEPREPKKRR